MAEAWMQALEDQNSKVGSNIGGIDIDVEYEDFKLDLGEAKKSKDPTQ